MLKKQKKESVGRITALSEDQSGKIALITKEAKRLGMESFIFLHQPIAGTTSVHINEVKSGNAVNMIVAGFEIVLKTAIKANPENKTLIKVLNEFVDLINKANTTYRSAGGPMGGMS